MVVVTNFTPVPRHNYRLGVPEGGWYGEVFNSDSAYYGGSNVGCPYGAAASEPVGSHGRAQSVLLDLPPLGTVMLERER